MDILIVSPIVWPHDSIAPTNPIMQITKLYRLLEGPNKGKIIVIVSYFFMSTQDFMKIYEVKP